MKNKKYYTVDQRKEQLIDSGLREDEALLIAFTENNAIAKELLVRVHDSMLDEVINTAFLSGIQFQKKVCEGKATQTQYQAMHNTKKIIRQMLNN